MYLILLHMVIVRAEDLHSFFPDPDPAVFLKADSDPDLPTLKIRILILIQLLKMWKNNLMKSFLQL